MKRISSLLKKRAHAEIATQCGERSDFAIRSQIPGGAAANYPAAITCASAASCINVILRLNVVRGHRLGQQGNELCVG